MNILLVDDEDFILEYLKDCINSMKLDINLVFTATSVDEALSILNNHNIAVIITDIRMPEQSGLDLLEILSQNKQMPKTILLSGYSEFEFAQTAIQHGAVDYLLKPIMQDELEEVLDRVTQEIIVEKKRKQELAKVKNTLKSGTTRMREYLLLDLFQNRQYITTELLDQIYSLKLDIKIDEACIIATIRLNLNDDDFHQHQKDSDIFTKGILNIADELFYGNVSHTPSLWACKDYYNLISVMIPLRVINDDFECTITRLNKLKEAITNSLKINVSIVATNPFDFNVDLHSHYLKVINYFLINQDVNNDSVHILNEQLSYSHYNTLTKLNEPPSILYLMGNNRWSEVTNKIDLVLKKLEQTTCYSQSQLNEIVYYLYGCFSYVSHQLGQDLPILVNDLSVYHNPFSFHSTNQVRRWVQTFISHFSELDNKKDTGNSFLIDQINTFIEQNIGQDVTLKNIGDHVYLHPVYLSRMYKKETGENISAYILRVRMEKAVQLLTTTNKRVSDIASEVGYQKTQYFIQLFRENYQTTPQKYRDQFHATTVQ